MRNLLTAEKIQNDIDILFTEHKELITNLTNVIVRILDTDLLKANSIIYEYLIDAYHGNEWTHSFAMHSGLKPARYLTFYNAPIHTIDFTSSSEGSDFNISKKYGDAEISAVKKKIQELVTRVQSVRLSEEEGIKFRFTVIDQLMKHYTIGKYYIEDVDDR